jgi:hypothetical protein
MNNRERIERLTRAQARVGVAAPADRAAVVEIPDVITFVTSPDYLNRPHLYPRQALLLKLIFLQTHLVTTYDRQVLEEWTCGFTAVGEPGNRHFESGEGLTPDVLDRVEVCRAQGRRWFRELVLGRRGSKGYLTALCAAYVIWHYLALHDPQAHYGIDRAKRLTGMVFAGDHGQAADNLFRDVNQVIRGAPCFTDHLAASTKHALYLCTPRDLVEHQRPATELVAEASLVIDAKPTTGTAGRGPAGFMALFDEFAHLGVDTARSGDEVYEAAVPSLDQFGVDGFLVQASSPANQLGKFYGSYRAALDLNDDGTATDPTMLAVQLPSWGLYQDWELTATANGLEMFPGGPNFAPLTKAVICYDDAMARAEQANPTVFAVERRAQWRTTMDAFLSPSLVDAIFAPYQGAPLTAQHQGRLGTQYLIHVDLAKSQANTAIVVAHAGGQDDRGLPHVVVDAIHVYRPSDYPDGQIDQLAVFDHIQRLIGAFAPVTVTFGQYQSAYPIEKLREWCAHRHLPRTPQIYEQTATAAHNALTANVFKSAAQLGLIHSPDHNLARLELLHLQERNGRVDHPSYGPVQTSDIADAFFEVTHRIVGDDLDRWQRLGDLTLGMSQPGGIPLSINPMPSTGPAPSWGPSSAGNPHADAFGAVHRRRPPPGYGGLPRMR